MANVVSRQFLPSTMEDRLQLLLLTQRVFWFYCLPVIPDLPQLLYAPTSMTLSKTVIFISSYRMIMYLKCGIFSVPNGQIQIAPLVKLLNL